MGGHAAGEVASEVTVQSTLKWAAEFRLADSLLKAHEAVAAAALADAHLQGMGSTVVAFRQREAGAEIGWKATTVLPMPCKVRIARRRDGFMRLQRIGGGNPPPTQRRTVTSATLAGRVAAHAIGRPV